MAAVQEPILIEKSKALRNLFIAVAGLVVIAIVSVALIVLKLNPSASAQPLPRPSSSSGFVAENVKLNLAAPKTGDCWASEDFSAVYVADSYGPGKQVGCSKKHDSVTYFIGNLPSDSHLNYDGSGSSLSGYPSNAPVRDQILSACREAYSQRFSTALSRLKIMWFIPDAYAWAAGARWMRCDVFAAKWGSEVNHEVAAFVTSDLEEIDQHYRANDYQICLTVGNSGIPLDAGSKYTDCSGNWDFQLAAEKDLSSYGTSYPGVDVISSESQKYCASVGPQLSGYYPTESGWANGDTFIRCWLARSSY